MAGSSPLGEITDLPEGIVGHLFQSHNPTKNIAVLWTTDNPIFCKLTLPENEVSLLDMFGNNQSYTLENNDMDIKFTLNARLVFVIGEANSLGSAFNPNIHDWEPLSVSLELDEINSKGRIRITNRLRI